MAFHAYLATKARRDHIRNSDIASSNQEDPYQPDNTRSIRFGLYPALSLAMLACEFSSCVLATKDSSIYCIDDNFDSSKKIPMSVTPFFTVSSLLLCICASVSLLFDCVSRLPCVKKIEESNQRRDNYHPRDVEMQQIPSRNPRVTSAEPFLDNVVLVQM